MRTLTKVSYSIQSDAFQYGRAEIEARLRALRNHLFQSKRATKAIAAKVFESEAAASRALSGLRESGVLRLEGQRRAAKWLLSESWVHHDHEVVGE
jgi:hypothetical protein